MDLVSDRTWRARWIGAPDGSAGSGPMPIFRRAFRLGAPPASARIFICGLGHFELRVNGNKAGDDVLEPGWTNYRKTCLYVNRDVAPLLRAGENTIEVWLGNGMYNVPGGRYRKFKGSFGPPKLVAELVANGAVIIATDESWQCAPGPITFSCIYGGEDHDARLIEPSTWKPAVVVDGPGGPLVAQTAPPTRVNETFKAVRVSNPRPGVRVFDLGQNFSGVPKLTAHGSAGAKIKLTTAELLHPDGLVNQKPVGAPVNFTYTLRGESEPEVWHPRFSLTGFRYVQAEGDLDALRDVEGLFIYSSAKPVGTFACSNELLNRTHRLILAAIKSNLQSVVTDCPHREKLGWLEQTHLMGPAIMFNFDVRSLYAKVSRDMRDAQHENGMVPTIAPQYTEFKGQWSVFNDSPEWGSAVVINPWLVYQRYGDRSILEDNYESMSRYADYLHDREVDGLVDYGLGDWYDIGPGDPGFSKLTSKALTATATFYQVLTTLQRAAALLGNDEDAKRCAAHAGRVRERFNAKLFDREKGCYDRGSQTAQAMPLALDMVDEANRASVLKQLVDDIRARDNHITAGDIGFRYVLVALARANRSDVIFDLLARTDPPSYGSQLARGATALTEAWDANPKNSQNHLMLGHAEAWFYEGLAGIDVDLTRAAGEQIIIRPAPVGDVTSVKATYESALGTLSVAWERAGAQFKLRLTTPVESTVHLPDANVARARPGESHYECALPRHADP